MQVSRLHNSERCRGWDQLLKKGLTETHDLRDRMLSGETMEVSSITLDDNRSSICVRGTVVRELGVFPRSLASAALLFWIVQTQVQRKEMCRVERPAVNLETQNVKGDRMSLAPPKREVVGIVLFIIQNFFCLFPFRWEVAMIFNAQNFLVFF